MELTTQFQNILSIIQQAKFRAVTAINLELVDMYWKIGEVIHKRILSEEWGSGIVLQLANFIQRNHPDLIGFSNKNLWRMKQFYEAYMDYPKLSPLVRQISWTHNLIILSRAKSIEEKEFYLKICIKDKYSKRELERQINSAIFERTMIANKTMPAPVKNVTQKSENVFKDSYVLDFLGLPENHLEADIRDGLVHHMKKFILELGKDFIFIKDEYRLQVGQSDFYIDILCFNRELSCLVAFEIKNDKFRPEYLGQLNFYLEALDRDVRKPHENPSIGILLCRDKDSEVVEYALNRNMSPTLVAEYKTKLPDKAVLQKRLHELIERIDDVKEVL